MVYCSVSGYGQQSPRRDWPAIDNIVQATSGMMSLSGEHGDDPMRVGFPVVDTLTGQTAAFAIVAALLRRERTGCGRAHRRGHVRRRHRLHDLGRGALPGHRPRLWRAPATWATAASRPRRCSRPPTGGRFRWAWCSSRSSRRWRASWDASDWLADPRFATPDLRRQNMPREMHDELAAVFATQPAADWEQQLSEAGIPCGMVRDVSEAIESRRSRRARHQDYRCTCRRLPGSRRRGHRQRRIQVQRGLAAHRRAAAPPRRAQRRDPRIARFRRRASAARSSRAIPGTKA